MSSERGGSNASNKQATEREGKGQCCKAVVRHCVAWLGSLDRGGDGSGHHTVRPAQALRTMLALCSFKCA
eukprot:207831-Alexandrium_andersonii.AAC.1